MANATLDMSFIGIQGLLQGSYWFATGQWDKIGQFMGLQAQVLFGDEKVALNLLNDLQRQGHEMLGAPRLDELIGPAAVERYGDSLHIGILEGLTDIGPGNPLEHGVPGVGFGVTKG